MVAGGLAVASARVAEIEDYVASLRAAANVSEFHWSEYRGGERREAYQSLVNYAFTLVREKKAELHVIIAQFGGYNHKQVPGDDRDTSVNRMYWLLGLHRLAYLYGRTRVIHMRLDKGNDSKDICNMRNELCAASFNEYDTRPNCIRSITPTCSTKSGLIQIANVLMGAIAARRNGITHSVKNEKGPLADLVLSMSGLPSWNVSTPRAARGVTVWNHQTSKKVPPSPI